ncbi:MAG: hypothetical protein OEV28_13250, partial [Nitrospirota bacterium]|nr:hypothetical protein [Nitrospirota bacterium]
MKSLTIKSVMVIALVLSTAGLIAMLSLSSIQLGRVNSAAESQQRLTDAMLLLKDIRFHVVQIQQFLTDVSATADPAGFDEASQHLKDAQKGLDDLVAMAPEHKAQIMEMKARIEALHKQGFLMAQAYMTSGRDAGNAIMKAPDGFDTTSAA